MDELIIPVSVAVIVIAIMVVWPKTRKPLAIGLAVAAFIWWKLSKEKEIIEETHKSLQAKAGLRRIIKASAQEIITTRQEVEDAKFEDIKKDFDRLLGVVPADDGRIDRNGRQR